MTTGSKSSVKEQIEKMSRNELLELINSDALFWSLARIDMGVIKTAKAKVLRKKAEKHFEAYQNYEQNHPLPSTESLEGLLAWGKWFASKQHHFQQYDALWRRADVLEFGDSKKELKGD